VRAHTMSEATDLMMREVVALVVRGVVPLDVSGFGALHDYLDANCLGELADDDMYAALVSERGEDGAQEFVSSAQNDVHEWIAVGLMRREAERLIAFRSEQLEPSALVRSLAGRAARRRCLTTLCERDALGGSRFCEEHR
jgi:hypothetical protein